MFRQFIITIIILFSLCIIGTAEIVPFNGKTTTEIMNRLPLLLAPATYVFFIWGLVYFFFFVWLIGYSRNASKQTATLLNIRFICFVLSLILNSILILLWHYEIFVWAIITMIGLLLILTILYFSYPKTENNFTARVPISLFFGWSIFSFVILINYTLTLLEWSGWGISQSLWTVIYLTIATAVALHFLYHYEDLAFNIVFMWGFIGIAMKNGFDSLFVTTASLFLTGVIAACFFLFKNKAASSTNFSS